MMLCNDEYSAGRDLVPRTGTEAYAICGTHCNVTRSLETIFGL